MEIYGPIKLKGTLVDGTGDELITRDTSTMSLGVAANALGTLTSAHLFVGNGSNVPTDTAITGDVTISNTGVTSIGSGVIVNADVNASAALAFSKMAALTASRALASDASGIVSVATTTLAELNFVSGASSNLQTQISGKQATITGAATTLVSSNLSANKVAISNASGKVDVSSITTTELSQLSGVSANLQTQLGTKLTATISSVAEGDLLYYNGTAWVNLPRGTDGQTLRSSSTTILWDTPTINGIPVGGTNNQVLAKQSGTDFDADWETLNVASITDLTATAAELNTLDGITATTVELNYTDGVSGPIQTQLDGKLSSSLPQNALFVGNSSNVAAALSSGTNGYVLTSVSGVPTWQPVSAGSVPGSDTQVIFNDGGSFGTDSLLTFDKTNNRIGVGTSSPDRPLHGEIDSAATNTVTYVGRLSSTSSGTPAAGIGAGLEFEVETAAGNNEISTTLEAVVTNVSATNEFSDLVIKTMGGVAVGLAEALRVSTGQSTTFYGLDLMSGMPGSDRRIRALGTGSNIDLYLTAKGTGLVSLGTSTGSALIVDGGTNQKVAVGSQVSSSGTMLEVNRVFASTDTVEQMLTIRRETTGSAAAGIGAGMQFLVETASGNNEYGASIETVTTDVTSTSEDFDLVFKTMAAGATAAEGLRLKSDKSTEFSGPAKLKSYTVAGVPTASSYTGAMIYVSNESGGAVPAFSDGTNWLRVTDRTIIS